MPMPTAIDWTRPWYDSIRAAAENVTDNANRMAALNLAAATKALTNHRGMSLSFVEQSALPVGTAYEAFVSATGKVPTRDNLHDFFNALVWLSFPTIKRQLNALQAAQIARTGVGKSRGATRDAATIFDENCALLVVSDTAQGVALIEAIRNHQWHSAFLEQRDIFSQHAEVWLFGHALMEKLTAPYKGITAHAWVVTASEVFFSMPHGARREWLDVQVANDLMALDTQNLNTGCFTPLPVLGVPGWWQPQNRKFYDDATVFRAKRSVE